MGNVGSSCLPSRRPSAMDYCFNVDEAVNIVLQTGDLVFESGDSFVSNFVETECGSMWSHVAMVYKNQIFEAVRYDDTHANEKGEIEKVVGCRLRDIREYFANFRGNCLAVRPLLVKQPCIEYSAFRDHIEKKLESVIEHKLLGKKYNSEPLTIFLARVGWEKLVPPDNGTSYFCSSLIAKCYQEAGLLDTNASPYSFLPDDFSKGEFWLLKPPELKLSSVVGLSDIKSREGLIKLGSILTVLISSKKRTSSTNGKRRKGKLTNKSILL